MHRAIQITNYLTPIIVDTTIRACQILPAVLTLENPDILGVYPGFRTSSVSAISHSGPSSLSQYSVVGSKKSRSAAMATTAEPLCFRRCFRRSSSNFALSEKLVQQ